MHFGHLTYCAASPMQPSSASTPSLGDRLERRLFRKIEMSLLNSPQGNGPLIHTMMSPAVKIQRATSYGSPDFIANFCEEKRGPSCGIRKSVPSTVARQSLPLSFFNRLFQKICEQEKEMSGACGRL
jgi:hypothetical protein